MAEIGGNPIYARRRPFLRPPGFSAGELSLVSSSRRWRPVSETNTSSRLTCRVVRRTRGRCLPIELVEQGGDRAMRLGDRQRVSIILDPRGEHRVEPTERLRLLITAGAADFQSELDDVVASQPGDQFGGRSLSDDLA